MLLLNNNFVVSPGILSVLLAFLLLGTSMAIAHCDTMDGPVVLTAKAALEKGDVTPVLKWVKVEHEQEIRVAFNKTLTVRKKGKEANDLADMYFFETVVRLHRAGEGAPYEGLKPAGAVEPIVAKTDKALDNGSVDDLLELLAEAMTDEIKEGFEKALDKKKHAEESVEAGREFVEAYVQFVHYVERLHNDIVETEIHHGGTSLEGHEH